MRLATVLDPESNEPRAVFELPNGLRVELRELFRPDHETEQPSGLQDIPLYFTEIAKTVEFLDDVTDAVRQWSRERSERERAEDEQESATDRMKFLPPVPVIKNLREFDGFESSAKSWRAAAGLAMSDAWYRSPAFGIGCAGSLIGHEATIVAPAGSHELDFGLQLGLFIGRGGNDIPAANAWPHVAGFTIVNAFVSRDIERQIVPLGLGRGKARDFATAVGPYLVSMSSMRDRIDVDDRVHLSMRATRNGTELARVDAATMQFTWPQMIEAASRNAELFPGDLLLSGTASNGSLLDQKSSDWLRSGDVIELDVERLGTLRTRIGSR